MYKYIYVYITINDYYEMDEMFCLNHRKIRQNEGNEHNKRRDERDSTIS